MPKTGCAVQGITERRKQAGLTVAQLAVICDISASHLEKIEVGWWRPSIEVAHRIARAVDCEPAAIITDYSKIVAAASALRVHRWRACLYLGEAAKKADVAVSHLCNVEAGRKPASTHLLGRLAATYGVQLADLTGAAA